MNQIVIQLFGSIAPDGQKYVSISLRKPNPPDGQALPFMCTVDEPEFQGLTAAHLTQQSVRLAGRRIFDALAANPHIEPHLKAALQIPPGSRIPILIEIANRGGAEGLPWETLCSP